MKLLLTGDSIIARKEGLNEPRLNATLKKLHQNLELNNTAVSGINSGAFYAMMSELVLKQRRCDKLIILLGTNDLAQHKQVPLEQFEQNMNLIVSSVLCQYYPQNTILITPPAVDETKQIYRNNQLIKDYATVIKNVARQYRCQFINLYQAMINQSDLVELCRGELNDGLHFGQQGYLLLGNLIVKQIK
ncbi:SGNH/GDSL hydrolase family protein [Lactobacillus sp. ESL0677]|uniref:SGNH/GDSL hydrolase family protein n=1 Tax=Lactobacillus sp. ESL0677 TaxID=2983208 RepID=UPI0023F63D15|nr:SGNH/GDSL hydrolase family protein [Lactobacillus sp. ESL0677]WEV36752.1 SGNH/GDSL hydrolase family protein [Lactobacillus sp. ESL0677]